MAASQFIALLESRGLLDPEIIVELYRQVEQSKVRVTPEAIAKLLVDNGQLTRFQATKLVTELNESLGSDRPDPSKALRGGRPLDPEPVNDHDSVDDLLPDEFVEAEDSVESVEVIEDGVQEVEIVENVKPVRGRSAVAELDDGPIRIVRDTKVNKKSSWESFRILGYGFLVLLLLVFFVPLMTWFWNGSANDAFEQAENAYKSQDYERAGKSFSDFAGRFPTDERASEARVFSALSKVRQESEKAVDPTIGSKACLEHLPAITNETAMTRFRGDVTDTLLRIAEKFVMKIENTQSIPDRKTLIDKMNQHMDLVRDPRYVGTLERTQNELRIKTIEENQSRLVRDIQKGEDLIVTIADMTKSVEAKNVAETYDLRRKILRKYPQLETDTKLNELLAQATGQQQELVGTSSQTPAIGSEQDSANSSKSVVLVGRKNIPDTTGATVVVRAKGAVYALNAATGQVLWRKHIGTDWTGDPKPLMPTSDSDVLISIPEQGKILRLASVDGAVVWEAKFTGRIIEPSIDGDDIFVSIAGGKTASGEATPGEVFCLDVATGQARWGKKFPQPIDVGPGGAAGKKKRYVLGNHSNLYVLSRTSGKCEEVEYIGHAPSSIAVPPIWIQNQLILFENEGSDYSLMRVFQTNEEGLDVQVAQKPIRFKGHVVIAPQVDRRRIAVLTNLGEIAILEVDALNKKDKVFKQVNSLEKQETPKLAWPLMVENNLLVASTRLALYQIQESSQKLNQQWSNYDLDQFTSRPISVDDLAIHTRVVRGNRGVRATAIKMGTGEIVWESDLGSPVTSLSTDGKGFLAVTAQGAAFSIDAKAFQSKQPVGQVQNLGRNQREMMFIEPIKRPDSSIVMMNQALGNQLLVIDPSRRSSTPTKMLTLDFADAFPASEPISLGNGTILVPLTNGQIAMIDPDKGQMVGLPFQPIVQAGERPKWLNPTVLADKQTAIVADQQRFMYKLGTGKQLRSITSQPLEKPLKGRLSIVKDVIVGVSAGVSGDQLDFYDSSELKRFTSVPVEGRFVWGPYAVESDSKGYLMALSDIDGLVACDETGKLLWSKPLEKIVLVGAPSLVESACIVASTSGELIRVALTDGSIVARVQIGEPISGAPLILPKAMLIPCDEGIVVQVPLLSEGSENSGESR